eukprot:scaffold555003_cov16-Prasinocladus_malaysianus.AAC.1
MLAAAIGRIGGVRPAANKFLHAKLILSSNLPRRPQTEKTRYPYICNKKKFSSSTLMVRKLQECSEQKLSQVARSTGPKRRGLRFFHPVHPRGSKEKKTKSLGQAAICIWKFRVPTLKLASDTINNLHYKGYNAAAKTLSVQPDRNMISS